jgi:formate dehydrogenase
MGGREALSYCRLCEAGCGVRVELDPRGAPIAIAPDPEHVVTKGFLCTKGEALAELVTDPRRLTAPLRRAPGSPAGAFAPVDWETATSEIAGAITKIARESGPDAVAFYQGNPVAFSWAGALATSALARLVGSSRFYTASSIDCAERFAIADLCHGHPLLVTIPDLHRARFALLLGSNPAVSTWAQLTSIPRWIDAVAAMRAAGGKLVVVDPRRTETTAFADEHLAIRPGTDADLLLGMVNAILGEGLEDRRFLESHTSGLAAARAAIAPYTLARAAERTGIAADRLLSLARGFARAPAGFAAGHSGLTMHPRGSLAEWGVVLLNAVCGRIDARGGLLFNPGLLDLARFADVLLDRSAPIPADARPGTRRILDDLPCAGLAEAIERGAVRALVVVAGNPAVTFPNAARVRRALAKLECLVMIDPYVNETGRFANYVLPPPTLLEREDCVLLNSGFLATPYAQVTAAVCAPPAGVREEWWIAREIARKLGSIPRRRALRDAPARALLRATLALGPRRALALLLRLFGGVSLAELRRHPHGMLLPPLEPGALLARLRTPDRKIRLAPPEILDLLRRDAAPGPPSDPNYPLTLLSRRRRGGMNSWLNRLPSSRRVDPTPRVEIHPDDAAKVGIREADSVVVASTRGRFFGVAALSDRCPAGVVSAPHSVVFGAADSDDLVTFNDVIDDADVEPLTGMPRFNGTAVRVDPLPSGEALPMR